MVKAESDAEYFLLHHDNGRKSNTQPLYRELELRHIRAGFITKRFPERGVMRKHPQRVVQPRRGDGLAAEPLACISFLPE